MTEQIIATMEPSEIDIAIEWAAQEGWNPGLYDARPFYGADPRGFFLGRLNGEPVSCISAVAYDSGYGFMGFYIVRPELRGQGLGLEIWNHAIEYLGDRNIGLDGVVEQQANYRKSGFGLAYRNLRFEGRGIDAPAEPGVIELSSLPFDEIARYDRQMFPAERRGFLQTWLSLPESHALAAVADGSLAGYSAMRRCRSGFRIGPLFADNDSMAASLLAALLGRAGPSVPVFIDVPEVNAGAIRLAEASGMASVFETARMYSRQEPEIDLTRIYGVTTLELG